MKDEFGTHIEGTPFEDEDEFNVTEGNQDLPSFEEAKAIFEQQEEDALNKLVEQDEVFILKPEQPKEACNNCALHPCGLKIFLNNRINKANVYNGSVGTAREIANFGEEWVCGNHVYKKAE